MLLSTTNIPNQFVAQAVNHFAIYQDGVVSIYLKNKLRADTTKLSTTYSIPGVRAIAISPNGEYVCVQTKTQTIRLRAGVQTPFNNVGPFAVADTGQIVMVNVPGGAVQVIEDSTTNLTVAVTDDDRVVCAAGRYMIYNRVRTITAQYSDLVLTPVASAKQVVNVTHDNNGKFIVFYSDGTMLYDGQSKTSALPAQGFRGAGDHLLATDMKNEYALNRWRPIARPEFLRPFKWKAPANFSANPDDHLLMITGAGISATASPPFDVKGLVPSIVTGLTSVAESPFGAPGASLNFDGVTSVCQTLDSTAIQLGSSDFTIKLFVKIETGQPAGKVALLTKSGDAQTVSSYYLCADTTTKKFYFGASLNGTTYGIGSSDGTYANLLGWGAWEYDVWHQIVITRSGTKWRCMQDGKLLATYTGSGALTAGTTGLTLGCAVRATGTHEQLLKGKIHNLQILNFAQHKTDFYAESESMAYTGFSLFNPDGSLNPKFTATGAVVVEPNQVTLANGQYLSMPSDPAMVPRTRDFEIEYEFSFVSMPAAVSGTSLQPFLYWGNWASPGQPVNIDLYYINTSPQRSGLVVSHDSPPNQYLVLNAALAINQWYSYKWVRRNGVLTLYVDGVERTSMDFPFDITYDTNQPIVIGRRRGGTSGQVYWYSSMRMRKMVFRIQGN